MPTPERLTTPLVLERGDITLDPPAPSERPVVSAAQVWNEGGPKQTFERYRLLLALYSSKFPAQLGPNGSFTPTFQRDLAWVIYSEPRTPKIAGCGTWGVAVFNPATGQPLGSQGYAPGP
jgi:hypothetical protein